MRTELYQLELLRNKECGYFEHKPHFLSKIDFSEARMKQIARKDIRHRLLIARHGQFADALKKYENKFNIKSDRCKLAKKILGYMNNRLKIGGVL